MNIYRIYWPDLDDFSGIQSESLEEALAHAEACQAPYIIEGTEPFPFCMLPAWWEDTDAS